MSTRQRPFFDDLMESRAFRPPGTWRSWVVAAGVSLTVILVIHDATVDHPMTAQDILMAALSLGVLVQMAAWASAALWRRTRKPETPEQETKPHV